MTNFDKFAAEPTFASFAKIAVSAERIFQIDPAACVLNCRRAMEFAVKWMYSVDGELQLPWDDKLVSLMSTDEFRGGRAVSGEPVHIPRLCGLLLRG